VVENLWTVTFDLGATKQAVTAPLGQKLVITKMKNMEKSAGTSQSYQAQ